MPKPLAYIETTIPNFYYDLRPSAAVRSRHASTREWWDSAADRFDLLTSEIVVDELSAGTSSLVSLRLDLIKHLPELSVTPEIVACVNTYLRHKLMPGTPSADAYHLALASSAACDLIVTWNCKHLANPNKFAHIRRINQRLGLRTPEIVTPLELLRRS